MCYDAPLSESALGQLGGRAVEAAQRSAICGIVFAQRDHLGGVKVGPLALRLLALEPPDLGRRVGGGERGVLCTEQRDVRESLCKSPR